jgi:hypothetical protein
MAALSPAHRPGCARLGIARLNAFRLNVYEPVALAYVNGVPVTGGAAGTGLYIEGATIDQILNDQTDTASFRMRGVVPVAGQTIAVYSGEVGLGGQLFGGRILETTQLYESRKENRAHDIRCVDPTWLLNRRTVLASYVGQSATAIVLDLIARFARGVTTRAVGLGLPVVDEITFTNEYLPVCLTAICERIGGHWYLGYDSDLHVFLQEGPDANAITDAAPHGAAGLQLTEDLSQVVTKVIGRGGGARASIDTAVGATELPVDEDQETWYAATGGLVETGTQVVTYSGVRGRGGAGALVGTTNSPAAPKLWRAAYGSLGVGAYQYGGTFVTAAGESQVGPIATIQVTGAGYTAPVAPTRSERLSQSSGMVPGGTYKFLWSFLYIGGGRVNGAVLTQVVNGYKWDVYVGTPADTGSVLTHYFPELAPAQGPLGFVEIYRTTNGGSAFYLDKQWPAADFALRGAGYWFVDTPWTDAQLVTQPPLAAPGGTFNAVYLSDIPVAAASQVTSRKIYRTAVNGSQPKLLTTIANNTATTYMDTAADAALGANPPASDTTGLTDNRQVQAGATELPVSSTAAFSADGGAGWVRVGTIPVRYTGVGAGVLTGIPATGNGALTAPVRYGTQVIVQPRLVGIPASGPGAIVAAIARGDTVTIRLEKIDTAARDVMAARLGGTAEDGVIEIVVSDSRFDLVELQDHLDATLLDRKDPHLTLTFTSRDLTLQVGRLITVNTTEPPISGTFRIHKIGLSEIAISGGRALVHPLKRVEASSKIYKFTDLLRRLRSVEAGVR